MRRLTKPGPATSAAAIPSACASAAASQPGQLARVRADLLSHLQGQIGGIVAVVGVTRALDRDRGGQRGGVEAMLGSTAAAVVLSSSARSAGVTRVHPMV